MDLTRSQHISGAGMWSPDLRCIVMAGGLLVKNLASGGNTTLCTVGNDMSESTALGALAADGLPLP